MALVLLLALLVLFAGCAPVEEVPPIDYQESAGRYREGVASLAISRHYLGQSWTRAAEQALESPVTAVLPFHEDLSFEPHAPRAAAFEFQAVRGHGITVRSNDTLIMQLFYRPGDGDGFRRVSETQEDRELVPLAERLPGQGTLYFEPREHGDYILLVQPKPLEAVEATLSVTNQAVFEWPVEGTDEADIWSVFGDSRDGGRRVHHGIDIFAPRGTPILSASSSTVMRVGVRDRGGNIVTLYDEARGVFLYYAHLEEHRTQRGLAVAPGETIGTVGNTGNAETTPPHLHLGIYEESWRRPLDPWYFFVPVRDVDRFPAVDIDEIDSWVRVTTPQAPLHAHPEYIGGTIPSPARFDARGNPVNASYRPPLFLARGERLPETVASAEALRVAGSHGSYLRVERPDGTWGYIDASVVEGVGEALEEVTLDRDTPVRMAPRSSADLRGVVEEGSVVTILAYAGNHALVFFSGYPGWIPIGTLEVLPAG